MHIFTPFNGFNVNLNNGQKEMYFFAIERKTAILTVRIWTWKGTKILHKNYYHFRFGSKIKEAKNAELKMHLRKLVIAWTVVGIFKTLLHFILKIWNQKVRNLKILWNRFIVWLISLNFCWKVGTVWKNAKFSPTFFPWKRCFHEILSKMREGEFP